MQANLRDDQGVEYCEVSIEEFAGGKAIPYDIFIRLSANKFVRIAQSGEGLAPERVEGYKVRNVAHLFLRKDDFVKYVGFKGEQLTPKDAAASRQLAQLCNLGNLTLELLFFNEMNEIVFGTAKEFVESTVMVLADDRNAVNMLAPLGTLADFVYAHSVAVSVYSVMIARQLGWTNSANIFRLALGGLLHDIGKRDIPKEVLLKPDKWLVPDDMALLREHPARGVKILEQVPSVPTDVIEVVAQHHETIHGTGYPAKLTRQRIHPMARIVAVANGFFNHVLSGPNGPGALPSDAIARLVVAGESDPDALGALKRMFKL